MRAYASCIRCRVCVKRRKETPKESLQTKENAGVRDVVCAKQTDHGTMGISRYARCCREADADRPSKLLCATTLQCVHCRMCLPSEDGFVLEWGVEVRQGASHSATTSDWRLTCTDNADIDRRDILRAKADAVHVKPLVAGFALDHSSTVIRRVADAADALVRLTASVRRGSCKASIGVGRGRHTKGSVVRIIHSMRAAVREVGPSLVMCFKGVLSGAF